MALALGHAAISLLALAPPASAHAWYSRECCGEMDCAPVERVEVLPEGALRVTSRVGTTVVPAPCREETRLSSRSRRSASRTV